MQEKLDLKKKLQSKKTILSFLVAGIVLYILSTMIDIGKTTSIIQSANRGYLALAFIVYYVSIPIRGYRWKLLLENVNFKGKLKDITEIWFLAFFVNCIVPAKLGDVYRGYLVRKNYKLPISRVLGTVVVERVYDMIFLVVMVSITGFLVLGQVIPQNILNIIKYGYALFILAILSLVFLNQQREWIMSALPSKFEIAIHEFEHGISKSVKIGDLPTISILTLFAWMCDVLCFYIILLAINHPISIISAIFVSLGATLVLALPITPAGLGIVEFTMSGLLVTLGLNMNVAASAAIGFRFITFISTLIVGFVAYLRSDLR